MLSDPGRLALILFAGSVALGWTLLAARLIGRRLAFAFLKPRPTPLEDPPEVTAIVAARDEEAHIAETLRGLVAQDVPGLKIVVVDDQSTDRTAEVVESFTPDQRVPIRLIRGVERPAGWVGKTWAVHQGSGAATTDWLLFVDADMRLHPGALSAALGLARERLMDCVSLIPRPVCRTFWQCSVAVPFLQLLAQLYPFDLVNDPARPEAMAAGGFILVRRSTYEQVGGHEAVRGEIVEDIQLARRMKQSGRGLAVAAAPNLAMTHMYGNFAAIWKGLRKNAYAGMDYQFHKYVCGALFGLAMAWTPMAAIVLGCLGNDASWIVVGMWGVVAQGVANIPVTRFLGISTVYALCYPVGLTAYIGIATASVRQYYRGGTEWKGRRSGPISGQAMSPVDVEQVAR